jgi:Family of unknown function (DUF5724)/Domain of unknown function (DUF4132)
MLAAEKAEAHLATLRHPDWHAETSARVLALDESLASIGAALIDLEWGGWHGSIPSYERLQDAGPMIDNLADDQRLVLMSALHPQLGATLSRLWIDGRKAPYNEQGFRAPGQPSTTVIQRVTNLAEMLRLYGPFDADVAWCATWDSYIGYRVGDQLIRNSSGGPLFATAIDLGGSLGDEVFETLIQIANGTHATSVFGEHAIAGLVCAARPEGWDCVERLLVGAQRQEGLRQSILNQFRLAHPKALERIIGVILDNDLLRFAAVAAALSAWIGTKPNSEKTEALRTNLAVYQKFLGGKEAPFDLAAEDPTAIRLALNALGTSDITLANRLTDQLITSASTKRRQATLRYLVTTRSGDAVRRMLNHLDADDLAVAVDVHRALDEILPSSWGATDAFETLERLVHRLPSRGLVRRGKEQFPRSPVLGTMLNVLGSRPLDRLLPFISDMDEDTLDTFAYVAKDEEHEISDSVRAVLLSMILTRSTQSSYAFQALKRVGITPEDALEVEPLLMADNGELRRDVIDLFTRQAPGDVLTSVERLWTGTEAQRDGACEVLTIVYDRSSPSAGLATRLLSDASTEHQRTLLSALGIQATGPGLGLHNPDGRTPPRVPVAHAATPPEVAEAAVRLIAALDELIHANRDVVVTTTTLHHGTSTQMLGDITHDLPSPFVHWALDPGDLTDLVLPETFRAWWAGRSHEDRPANALDALAHAEWSRFGPGRRFSSNKTGAWSPEEIRKASSTSATKFRYPRLVRHVLEWLFVDELGPDTIDVCLDRTESTLATVTPEALATTTLLGEYEYLDPSDWRHDLSLIGWRKLLQYLLRSHPESFSIEQLSRWFALERWISEPVPGAVPDPHNDHTLLLAAFEAGAATDDDVRQHLLAGSATLLRDTTARNRSAKFSDHQRLCVLADEARDRILAIELDRGDVPTAATALASQLGGVVGVATTIRLLARLGDAPLVTQGRYDPDDRDGSFRRLLAMTYPADSDTAEMLRDIAAAAGLDDPRLVAFAMFVPTWAALIEAAIGWPGLEDAVSWFDAHSPFEFWMVEDDRRAQWASRTTISPYDLNDGAVDVAWFRRAHDALGERRWSVVQAAASVILARRNTGFASSGAGRATLYADALQGIRTDTELLERIATKRHQDSVRALGLCPLPNAAAARQTTIQRRYLALREFQRGSKAFGNSRQANEDKTVRLAIENLARTAGYRDPQRLVWAMEAAEAGDLAKGAITATDGDLSVTLSIDAEGSPDLTIHRGDKPLKSIPSAKRNLPLFVALSDRKKALTKQVSRMRRSLEESMIEAEWFEEREFNDLLKHPAIAAMLRLVVFIDEGGATMCRTNAGYVDVSDRATEPTDRVRLAHPVDLLASGQWTDWQTRLFDDAKRQPFKQAFRELYIVTEAERATVIFSGRYEGYQVTSSQAAALFTEQGWFIEREGSDVTRLFPHHGYIARVSFGGGSLGRPLAQDPWVEQVTFHRQGSWETVPIAMVPPIVFSEAMRDIDLVVSVAHASGIDPESTESTVEMRIALVRETVRLTRLGNVRFAGSHVLIDGSLGEYSVHLGSGVVHRRPGGSVCIIPVDTQNRGRVFLPFADPDPKSAEIVSKVLLLANDSQIKDPSILRQLRS